MSQTDPHHLFPLHGGDLAGAEARFGKPAAGWLDLSTGINPFGWPVPELDPDVWRRLPDPGLLARCLDAARAHYGLPQAAGLVAAAGSQALIQALPQLLPPCRVCVLAPTYGEHAAAWRAAGHAVEERPDLSPEAEVVVAVNPNNPDGRLFPAAALMELAAEMERRGGLLVVDEAFADCDPSESVSAQAGGSLLVLRSVGKFFGLAGIRLGFAAGASVLTERLAERLGPWPVSGPALEVGARALSDTPWIEAMRPTLAREAQLFDHLLATHRLAVAGGTPLFRLVQTGRAWALYEHLGAHGILVRPFADNHRLLRLGLPGGHAARQRLDGALRAWRG